MDEALDWRPTASVEMLRRRARIMADVRAFFAERGVLEVETPYLSHAATTELHLHSLTTRLYSGDTLYFHTSPEYPMKRLLAAGSGAIWQACRVFRDREVGRRHNPEFSLLEWYRPGYSLEQLMQEVLDLVRDLGGPATPPEILTYRESFVRCADLDPFEASDAELVERVHREGVDAGGLSRDQCLDLLFGSVVCPSLPEGQPLFITRFPAAQASLARLCPDDPACAERFEFFIGPLELANGFRELGDAEELRERFERDNRSREKAGLPRVPLDKRLLAALEAGLPDCSGVALGLDRLLMALSGAATIDEVVAFPLDRA